MLRFVVCRSYISNCVSKCVMSFCLINNYWLIDWLIDWQRQEKVVMINIWQCCATHNCIIDHHIPLPCELRNRRMYRSNLPVDSATKVQDMPKSYNDSLQRRQDSEKMFRDRSVKALPVLKPDDHVRMQDPCSKIWHPGQVIQKLSAPRSCIVQTSAETYRRNGRHLRHTGEQFLPHTCRKTMAKWVTPQLSRRQQSCHLISLNRNAKTLLDLNSSQCRQTQLRRFLFHWVAPEEYGSCQLE